MINVLVLCTANSARSILGEAILNKLGGGRFQGHSAGSHPRGAPNPLALELLEQRGHPVGALRSKSWEVFAVASAPKMDIVITVCDAAAGESCPHWPGAPIKAHWGISDPTGVAGGIEAERAAFRQAYDRLHARVSALVAMPVEIMAREDIQMAVTAISRLEGATDLASGTGILP